MAENGIDRGRRSNRTSRYPLRRKGAVAGARADLRVIAAGIGALLVDRAQACAGVEEAAVAVGHPGQGEDPRPVVEMLDHSQFRQAPGNRPEIALPFTVGHQPNADKIAGRNFDRQAATGGAAVPAHLFVVLHPGCRLVESGPSRCWSLRFPHPEKSLA